MLDFKLRLPSGMRTPTRTKQRPPRAKAAIILLQTTIQTRATIQVTSRRKSTVGLMIYRARTIILVSMITPPQTIIRDARVAASPI